MLGNIFQAHEPPTVAVGIAHNQRCNVERHPASTRSARTRRAPANPESATVELLEPLVVVPVLR